MKFDCSFTCSMIFEIQITLNYDQWGIGAKKNAITKLNFFQNGYFHHKGKMLS